MPPRRSARSVSRKSTPLSPPKATPSVTSNVATQGNRATRSSSREVTIAQQQLQNITNVLQPVNESLEPQDVDEADERDDSVSLGSSSTGVQSQLDSLDREAIIEFLVDLYDDSTKMIALFEGLDDIELRTQCERIRQPQSLQRRRFEGREKHLLTSAEHYMSGDFIRFDVILAKFANSLDVERLSDGIWSPLPVLYIANLAVQFPKAFSLWPDDRLNYVHYMYVGFLMPLFVWESYFTIEPDQSDSTVDLSIDIFTQYFIQKAAENAAKPAFDPDQLADGVFFDKERQIWDFSQTSTQRKVLHRVQSIREHFSTDPQHPVDLEALRQHFPWSDFISRVIKWTLVRKGRLQEIINARGGVEKIRERLRSGDFLHDADSLARTSPEPGSAASTGDADVVVTGAVEETPLRQTTWKGPATGKSLRLESHRLKELKQGWAARTSGLTADPGLDDPPQAERVIPQSPTPVEQAEDEPAGADEEVEQAARVEEVPANAVYGDREPGEQLDVDDEAEQPVNNFDGPDQLGGADQEVDAAMSPADEEIVPTQQTQIVMATLRRQQEQSEKENRQRGPVGSQKSIPPLKKRSLLDRQPNAEKVEWSEVPEEPTPPPGRAHKRLRLEFSESEDSEDEVFQVDTRIPQIRGTSRADGTRRPPAPLNPIREHPAVEEDARRSRQPQTTRSSAPQRQNILPSASPPLRPSTQPQKALQSSRPAPETRLPPSTAPVRSRASALRSPPPPVEYERVNHEAKLKTQQYKMLKGPQIQARKVWDVDQTRRLIELIELCQTSFSTILSEDLAHPDGPLLQSRTQVQLKDKARNIKMNFLKARQRLPKNFEHVSIGNRLVAQLKEQGINYVEGRYEGESVRDDLEDFDD
ncbi:hypothetical protein LTR10_020291 [Elasticomyces elasticus]|uniref:Myb-like domain-containing protein n=1 Tax=Exophiala sideris TaxID=1016849 RepID=A0ABR0J867_9EURO|nr:hypothetical protein LTR10_020291 [Elasticomyces elasticus]KAK5029948.1 hypothetical protein LTS07_005672 [Exophiala sideris]KAK5031612.1 hypothetical protein LTR13_007601 [Exophiala sideris]KAK5058290.1 hypothetical protein LTR69_006694 [Exophiala sideris]KAK5180219.1 hypothetical protein LTR44_007344 [Eurotiomycetes sp. CCFEE 6388]